MMCNCGPVPNPRRKRKTAVEYVSSIGKWRSAKPLGPRKKACTVAEADKLAHNLKRIVQKPTNATLSHLEKAHIAVAAGILLNCIRSGPSKERNIRIHAPSANSAKRRKPAKKRATKAKSRAKKRTWRR